MPGECAPTQAARQLVEKRGDDETSFVGVGHHGCRRPAVRGCDELAAISSIAAGVTEIRILRGAIETHTETPAGHLRRHHLSRQPLWDEGPALAVERALHPSGEAHEVRRSAPEARSRELGIDVPATLDGFAGREAGSDARLELGRDGLLERRRLHTKWSEDALGGEVSERPLCHVLDQLLKHRVSPSRVGGG